LKANDAVVEDVNQSQNPCNGWNENSGATRRIERTVNYSIKSQVTNAWAVDGVKTAEE
jgi:hypothetical protein